MVVRLEKQVEKSLSDKAMEWVLQHPTLSLIILFTLIAVIFTLIFHLVYGMCTIESGVMRNYLNNSL